MTKRQWYNRGPFIASVGALVGAVAMLIGYVSGWPPEVYPLVAAVVGAALAVWRSGAGLPPNKRGSIRVETLGVVAAFALLGVFAVLLFGLLGGCSTVETHAKRSVAIDVYPKTCRVKVTADGDEVFVLTADPSVPCNLACPK